jgi:hypothetical protein
VSLKSQIASPTSPVSRFLSEHFPNVKAVASWGRPQLQGARDHSIDPPPLIRDNYTVLGRNGQAIDYRLRYYFAETPWKDLIASRGVLSLLGAVPVERRGAWTVLDSQLAAIVSARVAEIGPVGRRLSDEDERRLCQLCYVMTLLEEVWRVPDYIDKSPLLSIDPDAPDALDRLLKLDQELPVIDDLVRLSHAFFENQGLLLAHSTVHLNPTFAGSFDVGGADADLIVDECLIDIKTSVRAPGFPTKNTYQLLGYTLLDYPDVFGIRAVAIYFSRQARLVQWPLEEFLGLLGEHRVEDLPALRQEFKKALGSDRPTAFSRAGRPAER